MVLTVAAPLDSVVMPQVAFEPCVQANDAPYSSFLRPRAEALSPEGVDGIIDLANLISAKKRALEKDPARFFALTYPTADIRRVINELDRRFNTDKQTAGLYLLEGLKGTGKSHLLLLVYHLLTNRREGAAWLRRHSLECRLPDDLMVVINKFTDLPLASIWDFVLERLGQPRTGKTLVQPGQREIESALSGRRLALIFDELEQGIRVISDPAIQAQNVAFLQMVSEWGNRSDGITLFASIYSTEEEPGQTLKRVPNCRVQFSQFEDRERVVLHRLFENADQFDRTSTDPIVESYINVWRRHGTLPENYAARFRSSYPFTPDLLDLLLKRVPARGGFQGVRGALGFLANLVRLTHERSDIITPGHASLDDAEIRARLGDLEPSGDLIERARTDANNLAAKYPLTQPIAAATFLYTVASTVGSKQTGCTVEELHRGVIGVDTDINDFTQALHALEKFGAHFHYREARYYFDPEEQPDAKVEYKSLYVSDDKAQEILRALWLKDVFRDDGSTVIFANAERTQGMLDALPKDRLRFVIGPRRLLPSERHELFYGLEMRNQVILLEPKDGKFDLDRNPDLLKWAKRQVAAQELALYAEDAERRDAYERIQQKDKQACVKAIIRAGIVFIHWQTYGSLPEADRIEEESVPGKEMSREEVLRFLQNQLFPEQTFIDHLSNRRESILGQPIATVERDYQKVLSYPVPISDVVVRALKRMCAEAKIGLRHSRENVCGRTPALTATELRQATIDAPFPEAIRTPSLIPPQGPTGPAVPAGPIETGESGDPAALVRPTEQLRDIRCLPKDTAGELRIELASRLADMESGRVRRVTFKIFFQKDAGDLSALPSTVRGGLKGPGSVTAEWQIAKDGDFTKADVEQMVELLPNIPGAKYDATMRVSVPVTEATHV